MLFGFNAVFGVIESNRYGSMKTGIGATLERGGRIVSFLRGNVLLLSSFFDVEQRHVSYDLSSENLWYKFHYFYHLYDWTIQRVNSSSNMASCSPLVISGNTNFFRGGRVLAREDNVEQYLIVMLGEMDQKLLKYYPQTGAGNMIKKETQ
jgi:hypothetical protein